MSDLGRNKAEAHWRWLSSYLRALRDSGLLKKWAEADDKEFQVGLAAEGDRYRGAMQHGFGHGWEERGLEDAKHD